MSVKLKIPSGQILTFVLQKDDKLDQLKERVYKELKIPKQDQNIEYNSNILIDDEKILSDFGKESVTFELKNESFKKWSINLKKLNGSMKTMFIDDETKVKEFKAMINEIQNVEVDKLRLVFKGKPMEDDYCLTDYNVEKEDTIFLLLNGNNETNNITLTLEKIKLQKVMRKKKNSNKMNLFPITKMLGSGQFGQVYLSEKKGRDPVAVKKVYVPTSESCNYALREFTKAIKLDHKNLLKFYETFIQNDEGDMYVISISEYCNHRDLEQYLVNNTLSNEQLLDFLIQIMEGINQIHSQGMIHRDLKPQNIFLKKEEDNITLVIGDFGFLTNNDESKKSIVGTEKYIAPEVMKNKYDFSADIFSFGCILYRMIVRKEKKFFLSCLNPEFQSELKDELKSYEVPEELKNLILACLSVDPSQRPISSSILKSLYQMKNE